MAFKRTPPAYYVWKSMKDRCFNHNHASWASYGGRGITVCERWLTYANFAKDMLPRLPGRSIERIDNDGGYSPCNCYWADRKTQQRNQRRAVYVEIEGVRYRAIELAEAIGVKTDTILDRAARGLSYAEVMFQGRYSNGDSWKLAVAARKANARNRTHCSRGHPLEGGNLYVTKQGWKQCRACQNAKMRRLNAKKREARN